MFGFDLIGVILKSPQDFREYSVHIFSLYSETLRAIFFFLIKVNHLFTEAGASAITRSENTEKEGH